MADRDRVDRFAALGLRQEGQEVVELVGLENKLARSILVLALSNRILYVLSCILIQSYFNINFILMKEVLGRKVKFSTLVIIRLFIITPNWIVLQCILKFLEIPLVGNVKRVRGHLRKLTRSIGFTQSHLCKNILVRSMVLLASS